MMRPSSSPTGLRDATHSVRFNREAAKSTLLKSTLSSASRTSTALNQNSNNASSSAPSGSPIANKLIETLTSLKTGNQLNRSMLGGGTARRVTVNGGKENNLPQQPLSSPRSSFAVAQSSWQAERTLLQNQIKSLQAQFSQATEQVELTLKAKDEQIAKQEREIAGLKMEVEILKAEVVRSSSAIRESENVHMIEEKKIVEKELEIVNDIKTVEKEKEIEIIPEKKIIEKEIEKEIMIEKKPVEKEAEKEIEIIKKVQKKDVAALSLSFSDAEDEEESLGDDGSENEIDDIFSAAKWENAVPVPALTTATTINTPSIVVVTPASPVAKKAAAIVPVEEMTPKKESASKQVESSPIMSEVKKQSPSKSESLTSFLSPSSSSTNTSTTTQTPVKSSLSSTSGDATPSSSSSTNDSDSSDSSASAPSCFDTSLSCSTPARPSPSSSCSSTLDTNSALTRSALKIQSVFRGHLERSYLKTTEVQLSQIPITSPSRVTPAPKRRMTGKGVGVSVDDGCEEEKKSVETEEMNTSSVSPIKLPKMRADESDVEEAEEVVREDEDEDMADVEVEEEEEVVIAKTKTKAKPILSSMVMKNNKKKFNLNVSDESFTSVAASSSVSLIPTLSAPLISPTSSASSSSSSTSLLPPISPSDTRKFSSDLKQLRSSLLTIDDNWTVRSKSMNALEELIRSKNVSSWAGWRDELALLQKPMLAQLSDLRSSILREACRLLLCICDASAPREFESQLEFYLPILWKSLYVTIKIISQTADETMLELVKRVGSTRSIALLLSGLQDTHSVVREKVGAYLILILTSSTIKASDLESYLPSITTAINKGVGDSDGKSRLAWRGVYLALTRLHPVPMMNLFETFQSTVQKAIESDKKEAEKEKKKQVAGSKRKK